MKHMKFLKEMNGPQPLLPPGVARVTMNGYLLHKLAMLTLYPVILQQQLESVIKR
jgi:hypothetical protein